MIQFDDLKLKVNDEVEVIEWEDQKIEVKQYLPIQDKLNLAATIINDSADENGFYNPGKVYVYLILESILAFTNIEMTELQKTNISETYDLLASSGLSAKIFGAMNPYEYEQIKGWVYETIGLIYEYKNSVLGILETVKQDYDETDMNLENIQKRLENSKDDIKDLKDIVDKLG